MYNQALSVSEKSIVYHPQVQEIYLNAALNKTDFLIKHGKVPAINKWKKELSLFYPVLILLY
jgi:hypothetical protein